MIAPRRPEARFFLIGSGPLEARMRARARRAGLAPDVFRFLGHREDAARLYAGLDLFILSSLFEGLPYVVLEAMNAGLPVVATRIMGTADVVQDGVTGRLVAIESPEEIAETVLDLLANPATMRAMGEAGRLRLEERFQLARFIEMHEEAYRGR